jgi:hypothetical protein
VAGNSGVKLIVFFLNKKKKNKKKRNHETEQNMLFFYEFIVKAMSTKKQVRMWSSVTVVERREKNVRPQYASTTVTSKKVSHLRRPVGTLPPVPITFPTSARFSEVGG